MTARSGEWSDPQLRGSLFIVYNVVAVIELSAAVTALSRATHLYSRCTSRLNSVLRAMRGMILGDWLLVCIFLPRAVLSLTRGRVEDDRACQVFAWAANAQCIISLLSAVLVSLAVYRLVVQRPLKDGTTNFLLALIWVAGGVLSLGFSAAGVTGPYKNLYCAIRSERFETAMMWASLWAVLGTATASGLLYLLAYLHVQGVCKADAIDSPFEHQQHQQQQHQRGPATVLRWGLLMVSLVYVWWGGIMATAVIQATHLVPRSPASLDVFAAFVLKLMPTFDGSFVSYMIRRACNACDNHTLHHPSRFACADPKQDPSAFTCSPAVGDCERGWGDGASGFEAIREHIRGESKQLARGEDQWCLPQQQ